MFEHIASYIFNLYGSLGHWGVFLSVFIENMGVPFPIEVGYLLGQQLIANGEASWYYIIFILTFGHVAGSIISYAVGKLCNNVVKLKLKEGSKIANVHAKLERWYGKYGNITVFATRFIGYVRPWSSFVAGFANIPFIPFFVWTLVGSLVFNIIVLYFSGILIVIWRRYEAFHFAISFVGFLLFFGLVFYYVYRLYKDKKKQADKLRVKS